MSFVADPPPPDADARREFKYPYLACEIFCCELDAVFATLCEDECALFGRIVSFIDTDEPLHPTRAGYFGKVVGCVVARRAPETTRFFQNNPHVLRLLVGRIENLAVAEVLLRLVGADDPGVSPMQGMLMSAIHGADQTGWLAETTLLDQLLDAIGEAPETSSDADGEPSALMRSSADTAQRRANAAEVLVGIARGAPSALADQKAKGPAMGAHTKGSQGLLPIHDREWLRVVMNMAQMPTSQTGVICTLPVPSSRMPVWNQMPSSTPPRTVPAPINCSSMERCWLTNSMWKTNSRTTNPAAIRPG